MAKNDNDDDENGVRYATSTNASAPKMDDEDDVIKFDPLEFIPHFSYAWVVLGFVLPSVVSSLPIVQEQEDGGVSLLYQTRLCSEVAKLAYLSYALGKRNFTLSIGNQPQNDVLSGAAFGIGTSLAARVAEQTLTPALVESNSSVGATSTPAVLAIVLSSTVLAPITEEIFFRGVVLECGSDLFRNPDEQANTRAVFSLAAANVFAAGIFSLAHFNFSIPALLNLFICGIGFGLAFLSSERRNVTVPIIAHSVYNLSVLIESYSNGVLLVQ
jgi:membrane protease YdiL (CAAX protease family)